MAELRRFRPMSTRATAALTARIPSALLRFVTARIDRSKGSREEAEGPSNYRWDRGRFRVAEPDRRLDHDRRAGSSLTSVMERPGWHLASELRILYSLLFIFPFDSELIFFCYFNLKLKIYFRFFSIYVPFLFFYHFFISQNILIGWIKGLSLIPLQYFE